MFDLERTIERRLPQWFEGQRARLPRPLELSLLDLAQHKPKQRERYLAHRPRLAARSQPELRT